MTLNDLTDNYGITIEPFDARWKASIEEYDTGNSFEGTDTTPTAAIDAALDALETAGGCHEDSPDDYDDSMDGDHESALASAGFGTDEDYSGCNDEGEW
jgi:hypothetical protein